MVPKCAITAAKVCKFQRFQPQRVTRILNLGGFLRLFFAMGVMMNLVAKWCTVTVTDSAGKRHSIDVRAESSFDAAHLYVATAKAQSPAFVPEPPPVPTLTTRFEISADGKIHNVEGDALQRWILSRQEVLKGPKGLLFSRRPTLA